MKSKLFQITIFSLCAYFNLPIVYAQLPLGSHCNDLGGDPSSIIPGNQFTAFNTAQHYAALIKQAQNTTFDTAVPVGAGETSAQSQVYYIAPNGGSGAGTKTDPWNLAWANKSLKAGNTGLLLSGTYEGIIEPKNSGTEGNPISIKAAPGAEVHVKALNVQPAIKLYKDYILIEGFTLSRKDYLELPGAFASASNIEVRGDHITIRNMKVVNNGDYICQNRRARETGIAAGGSYGLYENNYIHRMKQGIAIETDKRGSKFNVIRGNTISDPFYDGIRIGYGKGKPLGHLIEKNVIFGGLVSDGITFDSGARDGDPEDHKGINSVIVRNNAIFTHAENNIDLKGTTNIVIEGNYLWGALGDNDGSNAIKIDRANPTSLRNTDNTGGYSITKGGSTSSSRVIIRNNVLIDSNQGTIALGGYKVYNNTILNNRRNSFQGPNLPTAGLDSRKPGHAGILGNGTGPNAALLNNVIGDHGYEVVIRSNGSARIDGNVYYNTFQSPLFSVLTTKHDWTSLSFEQWQTWLKTKSNYTGDEIHSQLANGGPENLFVNVPDQPTGDPALMNFTLASSSPAIDKGVFLTETVGSGSGKTMVVKDAGVFMGGFGITAGDIIQLDGQTQTAKIVEINGNKLTLNQELTWSSGVGLSLEYKGSRPDAGAVEFVANNDDGNGGGSIENNTDEDGDGILNADDAFPTDPNESVDTDNDGVGNNTDTDDDGDGFTDAVEIAAGTDPLDPGSRPSSSPSSLVAHYSFDNISGVTVSDQSGNGNDAIRSGTKVVPGKIGNGLQFDGKSDYVVSRAFDVVGSEITLSAWVKVNGFGIHDARIISKATGTEEQDHYWMLSTMESNGSKLRFRLKTNSQTTTLISTRNIPVGKWVHVMASYDGSSMRLYLDGKDSGSLSKTGDISANPAAAIRVGDNPKTSARNFDGVIDDVRVYNRALSAVEIQKLLTVEEAQSEPVIEPGGTPSTANLIFDNGFEKGGEFEKIGKNYFWDGFKKSGNYPTRGQVPQRSDKAGKFYLNKTGSGTTLGVKYRTEVTIEGDKGKFDFGKEYWISMDYRYENWDSDKFSEVGPLQLHTRGSDWAECSLVGSAHGTAPFLMDTEGNKARFITYGGKVLWEGVIQRKQWLNVIVNFKISSGSDGFIEVWKDGVKLGRVNGPNSPQKDPCGKPMRTPFFKMGIYKYTWNPKHEGKYLTDVTERELWIDNLKIAEGANGFSLVSSASTSSSASISASDPKPIKTPTPSLESDVGADNNVDSDGDGIPDVDDALPTDPTESVDTDGDGIGNNTDTDDDGDGYSDAVEIASGVNPLIPNRRLINSSSLVTHYTFDNISGVTVSDQSGNGNDAIRSGTKVVPGKIGNGLQFDGKSDYVVSGAFDVVGSEITLSAWIKVNNFSIHDARIISKATGTAEQDHYWMLSTIKDNGSKLRFRLKANGQTATLIGTHNIPVGKWVHVMASYDGSSMRLYLDGKESGSMSKTGDISPNPAAAIRVGDNPKTSARNFDGVIDDVRIYNQALSADEISDIGSSITPIPQSQPELELQPQSANLIFDNGFEGGRDDWNGSGASWRKVPASAVVSVDAREGGKSVRFLPVSNQKRSEFVVNGNQGTFKWGEEYWVGFSINMQKHMVDEGPEDKRNYKIISQHHSVPRKGANGKPDWNLNGGPNGFTIRAEDGVFKIFTTTKAENVNKVLPITGGAVTGTEVRYSHPYELNTWYDFVLHFRYAPDDSGIMEVFINGDKKIDVHGPTMYKYALVGKKDPLTPYPVSPIQYQKIGMYYGSGARNGEILYDAYRIGNKNASYVDVAPRGEGG